jgi:cytosine/adenosine deaminase-related metal-dependent hydrolase
VSAPWIVPIERPPLAEGAVLLDGETVVAVGPRAELRAQAPELPEERARGALVPALVNAHTHVELSWAAGRVPGGDGLVAWTGRLLGLPRPASEEIATAAARAAVALATAGTAAVGDVCNGLAAVPALAEAGLQGIVFHELLGSREAATGDALADAARERGALTSRHPWPSTLRYVAAPHAPYSVGPALLRRLFAAATAAGLPTSVHLAEDPDELALLLDGAGRWPAILARLGVATGERTPGLGPVAYLEGLGAFAPPAPPPLLVHMVHAGPDDRARARRHGATVVLCPRSNLHIGGRLPDVPALLADGVALALGSDSLASSPDLGLWGEMTALAARFPAIPPEVWLHAASAGGAAALGLPALGTLARGRAPGLLDVPLEDAAAPLASLVRAPSPAVRWISRPGTSS